MKLRANVIEILIQKLEFYIFFLKHYVPGKTLLVVGYSYRIFTYFFNFYTRSM